MTYQEELESYASRYGEAYRPVLADAVAFMQAFEHEHGELPVVCRRLYLDDVLNHASARNRRRSIVSHRLDDGVMEDV